MFELETATKAKLTDVVVLSQKNRQPDENPGAKLSIEMMLGNDALAHFDGHLKGFLFGKKPDPASDRDKQGNLEGVPVISDTPHLTGIGARVKCLPWDLELTGYSLVIDLGLGGSRSNLEIDDCKLSNWRLLPKEGGTVVMRFDIESADVSEAAFGKLAKLKSREIEILLTPPEPKQEDIDDAAPAKRSRGGSRSAQHAGGTLQ